VSSIYGRTILLRHATIGKRSAQELTTVTNTREPTRLKRLLQLRFDSSEKVGVMNHDSMLIKAWIHTRWHFTSEVHERVIGLPTSTCNRRMLPDIDPSAWMSFLLPWRTLLRHYTMYAPTTAFLLDTTPLDATKKWACSFFVVVESKPNRSRIAIVIAA